jgi:hypothetical protein
MQAAPSVRAKDFDLYRTEGYAASTAGYDTRLLAEDARQQIQVTYATHSPFFIEATHVPQVRRVSRGAGSDEVPTVDVRRRMDSLCIEKLPEALFAGVVILVEGTRSSHCPCHWRLLIKRHPSHSTTRPYQHAA